MAESQEPTLPNEENITVAQESELDQQPKATEAPPSEEPCTTFQNEEPTIVAQESEQLQNETEAIPSNESTALPQIPDQPQAAANHPSSEEPPATLQTEEPVIEAQESKQLQKKPETPLLEEITTIAKTPDQPQKATEAPPSEEQNGSKDFKLHAKDVLMAELKAMKTASISARIAALEAEVSNVHAKLEEISQDLEHPAAETVKNHIKLLHDYNDIRDVGQGLVGMIADNRGVRIGELYDEFGVGLKD